MEAYLKAFHLEDIKLLTGVESIKDLRFRSISVDLTQLKENSLQLYEILSYRLNVWEERPKWIQALNAVQKNVIEAAGHGSCKNDFPVSFTNYPDAELFNIDLCRYQLVQIKAEIAKSTGICKKQISKLFQCRKCKKTEVIFPNRLHYFFFTEPKNCKFCKGSMFDPEEVEETEPNLERLMEFREITVKVLTKTYAADFAIKVELDAELTSSCGVGDQITLLGTLETRSPWLKHDYKHVIRAISVKKESNIVDPFLRDLDPSKMEEMVKKAWKEDLEACDGDEVRARDYLVDLVASDLEGLAVIKLGLLLTLCSGGKNKNAPGVVQGSVVTRQVCHMLLVGDPGLGKSQIMKEAATISTNGQIAVGYSITTAGLTANFYTKNGTLHVEAGRLVTANNGVLCIDEIGFLSKDHRGSIHEVMESQKITISKGGFKMEIPTKCSIIAGMNQKNPTKAIDAKNLVLEQSLLSRFDLIFSVEELDDPQFTERVTKKILNRKYNAEKEKSDLRRLQMHILVARELSVTISDHARKVLEHYFKFCCQNNEIEVSRRTMRFWNTLERLVVCHAKLMLRKKAEIIDAMAVIKIVESTWTFGHLIKSPHLLLSSTPLGPDRSFFAEVIEKLSLDDLIDIQQTQSKISQNYVKDSEADEFDLEQMFMDCEEFAEADTSYINPSQKRVFPTHEIEHSMRQPFKPNQHFGSPVKSNFNKPQASTSSNFLTGKSSRAQNQPTSSTQVKKSKPDKESEEDDDFGFSEEDNFLLTNLTSLNAKFQSKSVVTMPTTSVSKPLKLSTGNSSNSSDKLKKFKFDESSQPESQSEAPKENVSSTTKTPLDKDWYLEEFADFFSK